jgi:uncharacterized membrane protein YphA (DoxX/SURF4 family)
MNAVLWVIQILLALFFLIAGNGKVFQYAKTKASMPWMDEVSRGMVTFIGVSELLGALGLVLPTAFGVLPIFTFISAVGIAAIMIIAFIFHAYRGEYKATPVNIIVLILAFVVIWGRM